MHDVSKVSEVKFVNLSDIASKIGGFSSFAFAIFGAFNSITFKMFLRRMASDMK